MELTPVGFVVLFLVLATGGWLVAKFFAQAVALVIGSLTGNIISFRVLGLLRLKDVAISFKKGPIESVAFREIRGGFSHTLSPTLFLQVPHFKFHVQIRDLDVILRTAPRSTKKRSSGRKVKSKGVTGPGRGTWRVLARVARLVQLSASDIIVRSAQVPDVSLQIRELEVDTCGGLRGPCKLGLRLDLASCQLLLRDRTATGKPLFGLTLFTGVRDADEVPPLVGVEHVSTEVQLDHCREGGPVVAFAKVGCGDVDVNLNEKLLEVEVLRASGQSREPPGLPSGKQEEPEAAELLEGPPKKLKPQKVPQRVDFSLSAVTVRCSLGGGSLTTDHRIGRVCLRAARTDEPSGLSVLDVDAVCEGIQVLRGAEGTLLQVLRVVATACVEFPPEPLEPLRAEGGVHLKGLRGELLPAQIEPWIALVLEELYKRQLAMDKAGPTANVLQKKPKRNGSKPSLVVWEITFHAPEAGLVVSGGGGERLYQMETRGASVWLSGGATARGLQAQAEAIDLQVLMDEDRAAAGGTGAEVGTETEPPVETLPGTLPGSVPGEGTTGTGSDSGAAVPNAEARAAGAGKDTPTQTPWEGLTGNPHGVPLAQEETRGRLLQVPRVSVEWGMADPEEAEAEGERGTPTPKEKKLTLQVGVTGASLTLSMPKIETLVAHVTAIEEYRKRKRRRDKSQKGMRTKKAAKEGRRKKVQRVKLVLEGVRVQMEHRVGVREADVPDPKKVNFGSQGGEVVFLTTPDGEPRLAQVRRAEFEGRRPQELEARGALTLLKMTLSSDLEDKSVRGRLEKCTAVYSEQSSPGGRLVETTVLEVRMGWIHEQQRMPMPGPDADAAASLSLLVTSQGVEGRWEPDVQLFCHEVQQELRMVLDRRKAVLAGAGVQAASARKEALKSLPAGTAEGFRHAAGAGEGRSGGEPEVAQRGAEGPALGVGGPERRAAASKSRGRRDGYGSGTASPLPPSDESQQVDSSNQQPPSSRAKKSKIQIAIDLEDLNFTAAAADGVEMHLHVESAFSEDSSVGVLLEGLRLGFNQIDLVRSKSLQVSRVPGSVSGIGAGTQSQAHSSVNPAMETVIQGTGMQVIIPYKMELRALDDAVEDMLRALKLVTAAQAMQFPPRGKASGKREPARKGPIRLTLKELLIEMEEDPFQGWLDEHMRMMRREGRELLVRERLLQERAHEALSRKGSASSLLSRHPSGEAEEGDGSGGGWTAGAGAGGDPAEEPIDQGTLTSAWDKLQRHHANAYKAACAGLTPDKGSGGAGSGFRAGFTFSKERRSMMSVKLAALQLVLSPVEGGRQGMVEKVRELDEVDPALQVPFSRMYGREVELTCTGMRWQLRDYPFPLFGAASGKCKGVAVMAAQATIYQPQQAMDIYVGRWRKVTVLRSISGSNPPLKFYSDAVMEFDCGELSYGVGYEPLLYSDISYGISAAIAKGNFSKRGGGVSAPILQHPRVKERSLPWWDVLRYYMHCRTTVVLNECDCYFLATVDPYEEADMLRMVSSSLVVTQTKGDILLRLEDLKVHISSVPKAISAKGLAGPQEQQVPVIQSPVFEMQFTMEWECPSEQPNMHYLHAFPEEGKMRDELYDPFRSNGLNLSWQWRFLPKSGDEGNRRPSPKSSFRRSGRMVPQPRRPHPGQDGQASGPASSQSSPSGTQGEASGSVEIPTIHLGGHDLAWILRFYNLMYWPPHKLRSFGRWKRFGYAKRPRSGNFSLSQTLSEMLMRIDVRPACLRHVSLDSDSPADGVVWTMEQCKYELCWSRNLRQWNGTDRRPSLLTAYQGLDMAVLRVVLEDGLSGSAVPEEEVVGSSARIEKLKELLDLPEGLGLDLQGRALSSRKDDRGFLLTTDYVAIRRQAPGANPLQLRFWRVGRERRDMHTANQDVAPGDTQYEEEFLLSDASDDDGETVSLPDNCWRVLVHGLKVLWTIPNRDAVLAWAADMAAAVAPKKPSPSRQWAARKRREEQQRREGAPAKEAGAGAAAGTVPSEDQSGGTLKFIINVIRPQFNFHSEDAGGRFLLAAASGRVLCRNLTNNVPGGVEMLAQTLTAGELLERGGTPIIQWERHELSVLLEHVQAHVAPTDVDPEAGIQWLPRIPTAARAANQRGRDGPLLQRVFLPCTMYFQYTRCKGGTDGAKVKPLTEISFNSPNITAIMTSRQFQILIDVITNLILARLPKPTRSATAPEGEEELGSEEATQVVPEGVEEVELARIEAETAEWECRVLADDLNFIRQRGGGGGGGHGEGAGAREGRLWMVAGTRYLLARRLDVELSGKWKAVRAARGAVRSALRWAAQVHQDKEEKPRAAVAISWVVDKIGWSLLCDGQAFAEAEISRMILNVDRDFNDVGVAHFLIASLAVQDCMPGARTGTGLAAWNPPAEWNPPKTCMLNVVGRFGAPVEGVSPIKSFEVTIHPLKIHLTDALYTHTWEYLFPKDLDPQLRQEAWSQPSLPAGRKQSRRKSVTPSSSAPPSTPHSGPLLKTEPQAPLPLPHAVSLPSVVPSGDPGPGTGGSPGAPDLGGARGHRRGSPTTSPTRAALLPRPASEVLPEGPRHLDPFFPRSRSIPTSLNVTPLFPPSATATASASASEGGWSLGNLGLSNESTPTSVVGSPGRSRSLPFTVPAGTRAGPGLGAGSSASTSPGSGHLASPQRSSNWARRSLPSPGLGPLHDDGTAGWTLVGEPGGGNPMGGLGGTGALTGVSSSSLHPTERNGKEGLPTSWSGKLEPRGGKGEDRESRRAGKRPSRSAKQEERALRIGEKAEDKERLRREQLDKQRAAEKRKKLLYIQNIRISRVELLVTYKGARYSVTDLRLLMDTFARQEYRGTWRRLVGKVKKHVLWGMLKSLAGMQGSKFKDRIQAQGGGERASSSPDSDSDAEQPSGARYQGTAVTLLSQLKKQSDRAGEGFVSSIRGLFNAQKRKARHFVRRSLEGLEEGERGGAGAGGAPPKEGGPPLGKTKSFLVRRKAVQLRRTPSKLRGTMRLAGERTSQPSEGGVEAAFDESDDDSQEAEHESYRQA